MQKKVYTVLLIWLLLMALSLLPVLAAEQISLRITLHSPWVPGGPSIPATGKPSVVVSEIIPEYQRTHPNVKLEFEALQGDTEGRTLYLLRCRQGTQSDIVTLDGYWMAEFAALGCTQPLDGIMPKAMRDDYYDAFLVKYKGQIHGIVPDTAFNSMLWYRTDFLKEAGLEVPKNWNDFLAAAKKLTKSGSGGSVDRYGVSFPGAKSEHTTVILLGFYWQAENTFVTPDNKPAFNNQTSVDLISMLGQTAKDKSAPPETINMLYQDVENMFYTGKTAMMLHGSWLSAGIEKANPQLQGKVGLAPNPVYPRVGKRGTNAGGWGISITSKDQRKTQAAWDFLYLLTGRSDLRAKVIAEGGSIPVMRSIAGGWKPDIRTDWAKTIIDELPYAKTRPAVEIYPDASLEYAFSFQEVFLGKDAKRAVTDAEARVTKMSRDKGYLK